MDIFKWLDDGSFVKSYIINDFRESEDSYYINLKAVFIDNSELHIKEYIDDVHRKYAFHWQNEDGILLI
jgi:hypothetical protein